MTIDFGRPFTYVFEDKDWMMKVLMGGLYVIGIIFCFVGAFALMGYQKRVIQQVGDGQDTPLPEIGFDRIGEDIVEGLKMFVVYLVYLLPAILLNVCGGGIAGVLMSQGGDAADAGVFIRIGTSCLVIPLQVLGQFLAPAGIIRFVDGNRLGAAFAFGEVFSFTKNNFVNLLLIFVIGIATQIVASFSILLLCIGLIFGVAWAAFANAQALGQLLRIARQQNALVGTR